MHKAADFGLCKKSECNFPALCYLVILLTSCIFRDPFNDKPCFLNGMHEG